MTLEPYIRSDKVNGTPIYIRISHKSNSQYIKTSLIANKNDYKGHILKNKILYGQCSIIIKEFIEKLNKINYSYWDTKQIKEYLERDGEEISFTEYTKKIITKLSKKNKTGSANNYKNALSNLQNFLNKQDILFSDISTKNILKWIESLENTKNAKHKYPTLIKTLFNSGLIEYNDYDNGILLIRHQPFVKVKIPKSEVPEKRSLEKKTLNSIFNFDCSKSIKEVKTPLAKDVAKLIFYLVGINTVDLYNLEMSNLKGWLLCYNRTKTEDRRDDKSYIEITVPEEIRELFEKYKGKNRLFNFSENYYSSAQFNKTINSGLKDVSDNLKLEKTVTSYFFRHSWANIAKNKFKASNETIALCLNHASAYKITEKYFNKDFTPIDKLNRKVINYLQNRTRKIKPFRKKKAD